MTTTAYCTLFRVGYWGSLDAVCETSAAAKFPLLINHRVRFRLFNRFGEYLDMGLSLLTGDPGTPEVFDEDGETFPDLDAAIRAHAEELRRITVVPGPIGATPPHYATWQGTTVAAV